MGQYNYKKGLTALLGCYLIWGFQPLYWNLCAQMDTMFLMACRIVWAAVCCLVILAAQRKLPQLAKAFSSRSVMLREIPAALFLFADWIIYLVAVQAGRVMECALGYYIMPLVVFFFGAVVFKEKVGWRHMAILAVVIVGIIVSVNGFGGVPYVTIALSLCFAIYSAIKKSLSVDSIVSTTTEILLMAPLALIYIFVFCRGDGALGDLTLTRQALLIGGGVVTGVPMLLFAIGVRNLPLTASGMGQYLSPTIGIFCGLIMGESLSGTKLLSFGFILLGVALYAANTVYEEKHAALAAASAAGGAKE